MTATRGDQDGALRIVLALQVDEVAFVVREALKHVVDVDRLGVDVELAGEQADGFGEAADGVNRDSLDNGGLARPRSIRRFGSMGTDRRVPNKSSPCDECMADP